MMRTKGAIAAGHELTARAAERILREGGNAFDAALAAICAACATEPVLTSLGGGGFLLAHPSDARSRVYDFFVHTPRVRRPPEELDFHPVLVDFGTVQQAFHVGLGSIATPGLVKGLFRIHRELGSISMREIVAPAVELAREGVQLSPLQAYIFRIISPIYTWTPEARAIFGSPDDTSRMIGQGDVLRQPELAQMLEALASEGDELFYRGEVARSIATQCRDGGGCLTLDDLAGYEVVSREPLSVDYRHVRVLTTPPPSSGGLLIAFALQLLNGVTDLRRVAFGSRQHLRLLIWIMELTNEARVAAHLDESTACPDSDQLLDGALLRRYRKEIRERSRAARGTTHITVMDARGNVATVTVSNGEGCGHIVPGTGIMLNNMLGEEDLNPHGFHRWQPHQRMTSMMSPSILEWPDGRIVATGSGGSNRIRTAILQLVVNLVDYEMQVEEAVARPRIFYEEGLLNVEGGFDRDEVMRLVQDYPKHKIWDELNLFFGGAHTVARDGPSFRGAGDPRRGGVYVIVR